MHEFAVESALKYGREDNSGTETFPYESKPDKVEYETYFGGIHKIDGATEEDLEGVKFTLKDASGTYLSRSMLMAITTLILMLQALL